MTESDVKSNAPADAMRRPEPATLPHPIDEWELVEPVGEGSLTRVYRARPAGAGREQPAAYAVKMLRAEWQREPRAIELLCREAFVGHRVSHSHLVAVLAAHVHRPPYFVVMPWLTGQTLAKRLSGNRLLDPPIALWVTRQVAEALGAVHTSGWMHGDVKPSNIFVAPDGHVTLLDLGFARRRDEVAWAADRYVTGTCNYIAPEMITSRLRPDIRSDVYSLGVVLFEMLAGRLPFAGNDLGEIATQHKEARPPDLRRLAPHLPTDVTRLVREMLAKDPLRRPQTPAELVAHLLRLEIASFAERLLE
ncbi:MAG: serine/threonine-protein kinase [Planctomycetota bacterium]